jgi:arfaptin
MEDTLLTVNNYEGARLEYDAYRFDMEILQNSPQTDQKKEQLKNLEQELLVYKEKYEKLKNDVLIKTKFLDENRIKVMKKQLVLFQSATAAYYSNNTVALEDIMKQFNINNSKLSISSSSTDDIAYKSFLEQKI